MLVAARATVWWAVVGSGEAATVVRGALPDADGAAAGCCEKGAADEDGTGAAMPVHAAVAAAIAAAIAATVRYESTRTRTAFTI